MKWVFGIRIATRPALQQINVDRLLHQEFRGNREDPQLPQANRFRAVKCRGGWLCGYSPWNLVRGHFSVPERRPAGGADGCEEELPPDKKASTFSIRPIKLSPVNL